MTPQVARFVEERLAEFDQISRERKRQLQELGAFVQSQRAQGAPARFTFVCTHNSRRSHMAQIWAAVAAAHYGLDDVETFSGGTEVTAFHPRAVAAFERAGFEIERGPEQENPRYHVRIAQDRAPLVCFSKAYDSAPNPTDDFCAVMVCGSADAACPQVAGALQRIAITYEDPKMADGTPAEADRYDERCAQIAREMLYAYRPAK